MVDDPPIRQLESTHGAARLAAALDRRAGVEQALTPDALGVERFVAVAEHDQPGVGEPAMDPALAPRPDSAVVHHGDAHTRQLELQPVREGADQVDVVVSQDRMDRSAGPERVEQVTGDDVAGMEDHVGILDVLPHVGRQLREVGPEVGVGEDEDAERRDARIMPQLYTKTYCKA